jgi:DNA-binding GntR family transcriptional regulator
MSPEHIADRLREQLLTGALRAGAPLFQPALAERFGVSRIPVRDALRLLASEGLVHIEPNRGTRVISLSPEEVREIFDLRILLECDCLQRAMARLTPADIEIIDRVRRKSDLDAGTPDWSEGDWAFHHAIYLCADRPRQLALIRDLRRICEVHVRSYGTLPTRSSQWLSDHRGLMACLRFGDVGSAIDSLRHHLDTAARHLIAEMASRAPA